MDIHKTTALLNACQEGNIQQVVQLCEEYKCPLKTCYVQACIAGQVSLVQYLIEHGVEPVPEGFQYAVINNKLELIKYLCDKYDDTYDCVLNRSNLYIASTLGYHKIVDYLLGKKQIRDLNDFELCIESAHNECNYDIEKTLIEYKTKNYLV